MALKIIKVLFTVFIFSQSFYLQAQECDIENITACEKECSKGVANSCYLVGYYLDGPSKNRKAEDTSTALKRISKKCLHYGYGSSLVLYSY